MREERSVQRLMFGMRALMMVLVLVASPVWAEPPRGVDAAFFAPGGELDRSYQAPGLEGAAPPVGSGSAVGAPAAAAGTAIAPGDLTIPNIMESSQSVAAPQSAAGVTNNAAPNSEPVSSPGSPIDAGDLAFSGFKLFGALAVVIALILIIYKGLKKTRLATWGGDGVVRRIASEPLGPNLMINVVEIGGRVLVLGSGEKGLTMLTELNGEAADAVRLKSSAAAVHGTAITGGLVGGWRSFGQTLKKLTSLASDDRKLEPTGQMAGDLSPDFSPDLSPLALAASQGSPLSRRGRLDALAAETLVRQRERLKSMAL